MKAREIMGMKHQYIERQTGKVRSEQLYGDRIIRRLYGRERENGQTLFRALTSARFSAFLGYIHYDFSLGGRSECHRPEHNGEEYLNITNY